jgi:hypothetical protein
LDLRVVQGWRGGRARRDQGAELGRARRRGHGSRGACAGAGAGVGVGRGRGRGRGSGARLAEGGVEAGLQ